MDNYDALKGLVEHDGRFRLTRFGRFHVDPFRDPMEGKEPIFGAALSGRIGYGDGRRPVVIVPMAEETAHADPEAIARMLLERAERVAADGPPSPRPS